MILVPLNTDAPLYYRPVGTMGLIAFNVLCWSLCSHAAVEQWALHYGQGWTPVQWVTSNFMHADLLHLLGNMFFLWGFGLIVEGKLGWSRFVPLYLALGVLECAAEQTLFLGSPGMSLGASSAIFGLMGIALLWAPQNELTVAYYTGLRNGVTDVSVLFFALLLLLKSALFVGLGGMVGNSEFLHLLGGAFGLLLGLVFLQQQWVDCEGWDLFSVMRGGPKPLPLPSETDLPRQVSSQKRVRKKSTNGASGSPQRVLELIRGHKPLAAWQEWEKVRQSQPQWRPPAEDQYTLAKDLRQKREWIAALAVYRIYLTQEKQADPVARLDAAEILILILERPQAGLNVLDPLVQTLLSKPDQHKLTTLRQQAQQLIADGILEMRDDQW